MRPPEKSARAHSSQSSSDGVNVAGQVVANQILLALPRKEYNLVFPKLVYLDLPIHSILNEMAAPVDFGYFVNSGLASVLSVMSDGKSVEVGLSGTEGFIGSPIVASLRTSPTRVVMQVAGSAYRISSQDLKALLPVCKNLEIGLLRYFHELAMHGTQVAACNRLHSVEQRLARWLLMSQDRLGGRTVPLTQEFLAHMLGTRRASVTVAAGVLQKAGYITYRRGVVGVKDREGLERAACECYRTLVQQVQSWRREAK